MSNLFNKLKKDRIELYKAGNKEGYVTLGIVVGDLDTKSKKQVAPLTDEDVLAILKKFKKSLEETAKYQSNDKLFAEIKLIDSYLPQQLSKEQLEVIISGYIANGENNVGSIMKLLKEQYSGNYDGKLANEIIKGRLS